jgi:N-acetylmuramoyl-L-alanine amidase
MKKLFAVISLILVTAMVPMQALAKPSTTGKPTPPPPTTKVVILDPGHGGSDPGAVYGGLKESDVNLDLAYRLKETLVKNGYTVRMTREGDDYKTNNDRYTFANEMNGSMLVSIHLNASSDHSINYTKGFYGQKNKDLAFTKVINNSLASELGITNNGVGQFASGVLLKSNMPATIAETVFITNDAENALLQDASRGTSNRRQQISEALFRGIVSSGL